VKSAWVSLAGGAGALLLALGATAAGPAAPTAQAAAVRILVPGQAAAGTPLVTAPPTAVTNGGSFAYPADGSIVSIGSSSITVSASATSTSASAQVTSLSLFGGAITADSAGAGAIANLVVLGQPVSPAPGQQVPLADWGSVTLLGSQAALDVVLTADHGGLPSGSEIQVALAATTAPPPVQPGATTIATIVSVPWPKQKVKPPKVKPPLGENGYVFPVYGTADYGDGFGNVRKDVPNGWHHGDDILAPLGAPVLAVAHGVVFKVGFEKIGGRRLWLRDDRGNEFYYAHLSAYSPFAVDGAIVNAGDVLGFVGNTGDAEGGPFHLHFEIHPVGLLGLGYDGAVDPTTYLDSWRRVRQLSFEAAAGWTPATQVRNAPQAGAVLLGSTDISSASGLDPHALSNVLRSQSLRSRRPGT
jgi:murein DD-endopeptidase MepM/ murein hydrolase activator NlpD